MPRKCYSIAVSAKLCGGKTPGCLWTLFLLHIASAANTQREQDQR